MEAFFEAVNRFLVFKNGVNPDSFASGVNFYKLVWIFLIGSVVGYVLESIWCYARHGRFESRKGVIYGPFSQIYGFGAVLFTLLLFKIQSANGALIFLFSAFIGAVFEYFCSLVQEKSFGTVSWEYSNVPVNLHGRTNLSYALCWGLLGLVFIKHIYPFCSALVEMIPNRVGVPLTYAVLALLAADLLISAMAVRRRMTRRCGIKARNACDRFLDRHYGDARLDKVYPNMIVVDKKLEKLKKVF